MVANVCPQIPPPPQTLVMGSIGQNSTFSEHGHVAYQINGNHEMQQYGRKYFARRSPCPHYPRGWCQKVKIELFQNMVMLDIKFIGISVATW